MGGAYTIMTYLSCKLFTKQYLALNTLLSRTQISDVLKNIIVNSDMKVVTSNLQILCDVCPSCLATLLTGKDNSIF